MLGSFEEKMIAFWDRVTTVLAVWLAKIIVMYKEKKVIMEIQAQNHLLNIQRREARELPMVSFSQEQASYLASQTWNGFYQFPGPIVLNHEQADFILYHMMKQYCLDVKSREEFAKVVASQIGIPALLELVALAHEIVGKELIVPYINKGVLQEFQIKYEDTVNNPMYIGTSQGIKLSYNLHSPDKCKAFSGEYKKSRKNVNSLRKKLQGVGVEIDHVAAEGIFLEVYLKWVGA